MCSHCSSAARTGRRTDSEAVQRIKQAGIDKAFPYAHLIPSSGAAGSACGADIRSLCSAAPRHRGVTIPSARLHIPSCLRFEPLLRRGVARRKGLRQVQLDNFASIAGPAIIGGDYNSTPDMRQFRDLLANGYRDAVQEAGAGFAPAFPSNRCYPAVITIDHVLTRNAAASSVWTIEVPGSDHRALLATVRVPVDPTAS